MENKNQHPLIALSLLLLLGVIWGSGYTLARYATTHGVPPLGYAFWQSLGPAILLLIVLKTTHSSLPIKPHYWRYYLLCGFIGIALPNTNMYFAAAKLPAGLLAVLVNIAPILTYLLAFIFKIERFNWLRLFAVALAIGGVMMLVMPQASWPSPQMGTWVLITLLTPLCFASCAIYAAKAQPHQSSALVSAAGMMLCSAILLLPVVIFSHSFYMLWPPFNMADGVIVLEILLSSLGYIIFFRLLQIAGPVYYSFVGAIVGLTGLMWGRIIFGERLNQWNSLAIFIILAAISLVTFSQWSEAKKNIKG